MADGLVSINLLYAHPSTVALNTLTGFASGLERRVDDLYIPRLSTPIA
jgi:hypothetical protein